MDSGDGEPVLPSTTSDERSSPQVMGDQPESVELTIRHDQGVDNELSGDARSGTEDTVLPVHQGADHGSTTSIQGNASGDEGTYSMVPGPSIIALGKRPMTMTTPIHQFSRWNNYTSGDREVQDLASLDRKLIHNGKKMKATSRGDFVMVGRVSPDSPSVHPDGIIRTRDGQETISYDALRTNIPTRVYQPRDYTRTLLAMQHLSTSEVTGPASMVPPSVLTARYRQHQHTQQAAAAAQAPPSSDEAPIFGADSLRNEVSSSQAVDTQSSGSGRAIPAVWSGNPRHSQTLPPTLDRLHLPSSPEHDQSEVTLGRTDNTNTARTSLREDDDSGGQRHSHIHLSQDTDKLVSSQQPANEPELANESMQSDASATPEFHDSFSDPPDAAMSDVPVTQQSRIPDARSPSLEMPHSDILFRALSEQMNRQLHSIRASVHQAIEVSVQKIEESFSRRIAIHPDEQLAEPSRHFSPPRVPPDEGYSGDNEDDFHSRRQDVPHAIQRTASPFRRTNTKQHIRSPVPRYPIRDPAMMAAPSASPRPRSSINVPAPPRPNTSQGNTLQRGREWTDPRDMSTPQPSVLTTQRNQQEGQQYDIRSEHLAGPSGLSHSLSPSPHHGMMVSPVQESMHASYTMQTNIHPGPATYWDTQPATSSRGGLYDHRSRGERSTSHQAFLSASAPSASRVTTRPGADPLFSAVKSNQGHRPPRAPMSQPSIRREPLHGSGASGSHLPPHPQPPTQMPTDFPAFQTTQSHGTRDEAHSTEADADERIVRELLPTRRSLKRLEVLATVRQHFRLLMNRPQSNSGFDLTRIPTPAEIASFDPEQGRACSPALWRVDLVGELRSAWNRSCFKVWLYSYWDMGYEYRDEQDLEKIFFNHLRYLQGLYRDLSLNDRAWQDRQTYRNRSSRKRSLLDRRIRAALSRGDTSHHAWMLGLLGTAGMSSDESDNESGVPIFRIKTLRWRHPDVTNWLRCFDAIHRMNRFGPLLHSTRGAHPRERVESGLTSDERRTAPRRLPSNAYNPTWVERLTPWHMQDLGAGPVYNFTHSAEVQRIAMSYSGVHGATA